MPDPNPNPALLPCPALFDVTTVAKAAVEGTLERVPLAELELAANPRKQLSADSIHSLAALLMRTGQLIPCIGVRPNPAGPARCPLRRAAPPARRPSQPRACRR